MKQTTQRKAMGMQARENARLVMAVMVTAGLALGVVVGCGEQPAPETGQSSAGTGNANVDSDTAGSSQSPPTTNPPPPSSDQAPPPGAPAITSLPQLDHAGMMKLVAESARRDQVVVVDMWATWCAPCVAMFPSLHSGLKAMGDVVRPMTLTLDAPEETEAAAIAFLQKHDALTDAYLLVPDSDVQLNFVEKTPGMDTLVVPIVIVFDKAGQVSEVFTGGDSEPILQHVRSLVGS